MSVDLPIGRGDNAPAPTWRLGFAVAGSDFELRVQSRGATSTYTVSNGTLALDPVGNTVAWMPTLAESAALPDVSSYTLRRIVPGGERRYVAEGRILARDGPVGSAAASVEVPGPQGPEGKVGATGASAYDLAGGDARWGSLDAWQAAQSSAGVVQRCYPIAVAAPGQTRLPLSPPPITLSTLVLTVNGVDYRAPSALSADEIAVTWSGAFALDPSDDVHVSYF